MSRQDVVSSSFYHDMPSPVARSVEDIAIMLDIMASYTTGVVGKTLAVKGRKLGLPWHSFWATIGAVSSPGCRSLGSGSQTEPSRPPKTSRHKLVQPRGDGGPQRRARQQHSSTWRRGPSRQFGEAKLVRVALAMEVLFQWNLGGPQSPRKSRDELYAEGRRQATWPGRPGYTTVRRSPWIRRTE